MEQTSLPSSGRFISLRETLGKNGCRTAEHPCGRAGVGAVEVLGSCAVLVGPVGVATGPNPQLELDHAFTREGTVVSRGCPADHGVYLAQSGYSGPMCSRIMATYWRSVTTSRSSLPASGAPILDDIVGDRRGGAVGEVVPLRGGRGVVGSVYPIPPVFRREILGEAFVVVCVDISGGSVTTMDLPHQGRQSSVYWVPVSRSASRHTRWRVWSMEVTSAGHMLSCAGAVPIYRRKGRRVGVAKSSIGLGRRHGVRQGRYCG